jgi:hypothetical protein
MLAIPGVGRLVIVGITGVAVTLFIPTNDES